MFSEVDVLGAFVPVLVVWLAPALVIFVIVDALLTKVGILSSLLARAAGPLRSVCGVFLRRRTRVRRELKESTR